MLVLPQVRVPVVLLHKNGCEVKNRRKVFSNKEFQRCRSGVWRNRLAGHYLCQAVAHGGEKYGLSLRSFDRAHRQIYEPGFLGAQNIERYRVKAGKVGPVKNIRHVFQRNGFPDMHAH